MNITENGETPKFQNNGYHQTPDLSQRLDLITHLLANTSLIPFIQASEGSGKTRLYHHLSETLADRYTIMSINGENGDFVASIHSRLTELLEIDGEVDDAALQEQICILYERKNPLLILIDDAEQLPAEGLAWLIGIMTNPEVQVKSKCVIFSAVDVLALPLSPVQLSSLGETIQALDIPPLSAEQLAGFVASIDPIKSALLEPENYTELMKNSGGNVGKLLWQLQYVNSAPKPQQDLSLASANKMKPLYVVAGILFVSALASILIFQDEINRNLSEKPVVGQQQELEIKSLPLPPPVVAVTETIGEQDLKVSVAKEGTQKPEELQSAVEPFQVETEEDISPKVESSVESSLPEPRPDEQLEKKIPSEIVSDKAAEIIAIETFSKQDSIAQAAVLEQKEIVNEEKMQAAEMVVTNPEAVAKQQQENSIQVTTPEPLKIQPPAEKLEENKLAEKSRQRQMDVKSVAWLINQADKSYTLQLLAVSEEKGIKRFLQLHKIRGDLVVMETKRNGKPWFALLYGAYISRDEALRARKSLPATYKSSGAWPRSILSIRQAIQAK